MIIKKVFLSLNVIIIIFAITSCTQKSDDIAYKVKYSYFLDHESTTANENENVKKFKFDKKEWEEKIILNEETEYGSDDGNIWEVSLKDNKIMISSIQKQISEVNPSQQYGANLLKFDVDDGYFVSKNDEDYGGLGGILDFVGNDGVSYTISKHLNTLIIFSINDDIFLLEGMSYRSHDRGYLYKLSNFDGKWEIKGLINEVSLGGYPYQYMIDKSDIYIIVYERMHDNYIRATNTSTIIKISTSSGDMKMKEIVKTVFMPTSSMAKKDNTLYIGLAGSIAEVNLSNNEIKFYVKK